MSYRAKAKTIVEAVSRSPIGPSFDLGACYGTKIQKRLAYIAVAEKTSDWYEFVRVSSALSVHGSIRAAVVAGFFEREVS